MTDTVTPICAIAAELYGLWEDINRADRASVSRTGRGVPTPIILDNFLEEATKRVRDAEDYLLTLPPTCLQDVIVLLNIVSSQVDAPETADMRRVARVLGEVTAFLEQETGTSIQSLGGKAIGYNRLATWPENVMAVRKWLDQPENKQAASTVASGGSQ